MENKNMTALISCFVRCYHSKNNKYKIYDDLSEKILTEKEYEDISYNIVKGIKFFNENLTGSDKEILKYIVDKQLAPSVLARSIFLEDNLKKEINLGLSQYLVFASGYDTSIYKIKEDISMFEIDRKEMIKDKKKRLKEANINFDKVNFIESDFTDDSFIDNILNSSYKKERKSFCSLLGISYYLDKNVFMNMLNSISNNISNGSVIVFDYPTYNESNNEKLNQKLASGAGEDMKSKYDFKELESFADNHNLLIYKNLNNEDIDNEYFYNYNTLNPNDKINAPLGINYCLMVKKI